MWMERKKKSFFSCLWLKFENDEKNQSLQRQDNQWTISIYCSMYHSSIQFNSHSTKKKRPIHLDKWIIFIIIIIIITISIRPKTSQPNNNKTKSSSPIYDVCVCGGDRKTKQREKKIKFNKIESKRLSSSKKRHHFWLATI